MLFSGIQIGLIEIIIFILIGFGIKITTKEYKSIDLFTFYWTLMTILTLIWEVSFILDYRNTNILSTQLIKSNDKERKQSDGIFEKILWQKIDN